jgi:hypothetical protein
VLHTLSSTLYLRHASRSSGLSILAVAHETQLIIVTLRCCVLQAFGSLGILALILTSGFAIIKRKQGPVQLPNSKNLQRAQSHHRFLQPTLQCARHAKHRA